MAATRVITAASATSCFLAKRAFVLPAKRSCGGGALCFNRRALVLKSKRPFSCSAIYNPQVKVKEEGQPETLDYRVFFLDGSGKKVSPWHDIPLTLGDGVYNFIVEIPKESKAKMEVATDEDFTPIKQDTKKGKLRYYPYNINWNYGLLPQTWEDPSQANAEVEGAFGDNDPVYVSIFTSFNEYFCFISLITPKPKQQTSRGLHEKMDPIATVKDGFNQVAKRQKHYHTISQAVTDGAFEGFVESLVQILTKNDPKTVLTELKLKLDSLLPINHLQESQKETNTSLTKFEKFLGKSDMFPASISIDLDHQLVDKMLVEYLYRQGLFEVGELLIKESEVDVDGQLSEAIARSLEIHRVTEPLKEKDTEPAMRWISENREKLKEDGSKLEMELVSLKYWEMLRQRKRSEALRFARAHFPKFASLHNVKIRKLIVALLWVKDLENYPHAEELFPLGWDKASRELTKQYYNLHDQPSSSLLAVALSAGVESLPRLLKLVRVMGLEKEEWGEMKQLPVDLELGDEFRFHSVFVCPVSREQSDEYNPPMMMPCRHVLCKETILRLCKCCSTRRFKCPYCPAYTTASACRQLYI
ncbi:unnamed protein product [Brassica napus]|uniref:inorganic diphosphatase n=3 Tax=Brassica TaxID=3705 RepID=A0A816I5W6_BRANA|nr:unnamed protein product [Brassica napus]